jgi:hypothetical protein
VPKSVTLRDIGGYLLDPMSAIGDFARYTTGDLLFPMERHLNSMNAKQNEPLVRAPLASLGQRYRQPPPATFEERWSPLGPAPAEQEMLRRLLLEQEQRRRTPEAPEGYIMPGSRTWPFGYTQI